MFQVYPEAVATLPGSNIWAMLFFFMLIMLGLDSGASIIIIEKNAFKDYILLQMGGLECVITGLTDEFSHFFKKRKISRETFTLVVIILSFSVALVNLTPVSSHLECNNN